MKLNQHQMFPVTTMQISWLDQWIPWFPSAVYLYESIFLLMPIAPWLTVTKSELNAYCIGFIFMSLVGFCIFFFFPTLNPRPQVINGANSLYLELIRFDNGINACPSFHAAFTVYHGILCHFTFNAGNRNRWVRRIIWVWALGILASALLTKQHVFMDLVAGSLLGICGAALCRISLKLSSQWKERPGEQREH
ncbi:MAG: phosphatase PAP2 family protein [Acidobacteriota bacterium]